MFIFLSLTDWIVVEVVRICLGRPLLLPSLVCATWEENCVTAAGIEKKLSGGIPIQGSQLR